MDVPSNQEVPEVLCSITTAATFGDPPMDWRTAIKDTTRCGIDRFALFLTGLDPVQRKTLYYALMSHRLRHEITIPFVHARGDMHPDEYRFLIGEFGTERFNLHKACQQRHEHKLPFELRRRIYIENAWRIEASDLDRYAGICLDLSHLQATLYVSAQHYAELTNLLERFPIGANHVSAFTLATPQDGRRDRHFTTSSTDFDYLSSFPKRYFARYVAIELSNPLAEQLEVKDRIEKLLARP